MDFKQIVADEKFRAIKKIVYEKYLDLYKDEAKQDLQKFFDDHVPGHGADSDLEKMNKKEIERYQANTKLSPQNTVALLVTFSPDEKLNMTIAQMKALGCKLTKPNKGIKHWCYTLEQRGEIEEEMGIGIHIHAILELNKEDQSGEVSRQVRRIVTLFQKYRTKTDHFLQIKRVSAEKLDEKWDYVQGNKFDYDKDAKMRIDEIWREQNNIAPNYLGLTERL